MVNPNQTLKPLPDPEVLYDHWLYEGLSLRKIGRMYGWSRTTVQAVIRSKYGRDATNPRVNSLARVVAQEYGEAYQSTLTRAMGIRGLYRTSRKEANLSTFQAIGFTEGVRTYEDPTDHYEGLKLPLFTLFATGLTEILRGLASSAYEDHLGS